MTPVRHVTSTDGTVIAYERSGGGPPVILVGGAFGDRREPTVAGLARALAPRFTVYNYDRRGRGDSGDTAPYTVRREIEDLGALIAEAGGEAMVFGGSSGGALALEAATVLDAGAGVSIGRLVVFEPPYVTDGPPLPGERELNDLVASGRRDLAVELFMIGGARIPAETVAAMKEQPFWADSEAVAHTLAYEAAIMGAGPVPVERFARITVPTLVLAGSASPPRMATAAAAVASAVPGALLRTLDGQAHGILDPEVLARAVAAFLGPEPRPGSE
jgi:pimeloyl-ACP methyl ester carboxylesterase